MTSRLIHPLNADTTLPREDAFVYGKAGYGPVRDLSS